MDRKLTNACKRINDHQRITMFLASSDVQSLRHLLSVSLCKGASPSAILAQMQCSLDGKYNPQIKFSKHDLAIGFLAKSLGGPQLLYALSKGDRYPSVSTVAQKYHIPRIIPSVSVPTWQEILDNIKMFFGSNGKLEPKSVLPSQSLPGHILMIDGVALNKFCRYDADQNCILGLCHEHSHTINTHIVSLDTVRAVEKAIHNEKTCCYGKDGTVVTIGPYADTEHYTLVPIVVLPSCKKENAQQLLRWIKLVLAEWKAHPDGEAKHGPIWTIGSDGESSFRSMHMSLCMTRSVDPNSELGHILDTLSGLNQQTGEDDSVGTCDPKHIIKSRRCANATVIVKTIFWFLN